MKGLESACHPPRTPWGPQRPEEQNLELILLVPPTPLGAHVVICEVRGWDSHVECCPSKAVLEPFGPLSPQASGQESLPIDLMAWQGFGQTGLLSCAQVCSVSLHRWEGWPPYKGLLGQKARAGHSAPR